MVRSVALEDDVDGAVEYGIDADIEGGVDGDITPVKIGVVVVRVNES